jgi:superfamily I DNA/RNA helicase
MGARPRLVQYIASDMPQDVVAGIVQTFLKQKGNRIDDVLDYLNVEDHMKSEAQDIFYHYAGSTIEEYRSEEAEPEWIAEGEGVTVGTVHWSKGGEWPIVIVPFVDEGKWPRKKKTAEERRVLYVAITRAMEELHILHGDKPSPFVDFFKTGLAMNG